MKLSPVSSPSRFPGKAWLISAAVLAVSAAGWWLGRQSPGLEVPPATALAATSPPPGSPTAFPSNLPPLVQEWMSEIGKESTPSAQAAAAARLVSRLSPAEWPEMLNHVSRFDSALVRTVLEAAVIRRWAAADPAKAADWGILHYPALAAAAGAEWLRQDSPAALEWFAGLTPQQRAAGLVWNEFYRTFLARDPAACLDLILSHQLDPGFQLGGIDQAIAAASPERALEFAAKLTKEDVRDSLREAVAAEKGRRDPQAAVAWALREPDGDKMLAAVFRQYKIPPSDMIPAFASLTAEDQKMVHEKSWVWWERGDPFATLEALKHPPDNLTDDSRKKLLARAMSTLTPRFDLQESASRLASEFPELSGKWERWIADEWISRDPGGARQWIETLAPGEVRDKALQSYEKKMGEQQQPYTDPGEHLARMMSQPSDRMMGMDGLVAQLTPVQRQTAWDKVSALPTDQRNAAQSNLIALQAGIDPVQAAAWLAPTQPDSPPASPELTSRLAASWALDDAPAAARWVDSLPEGDSRKWALWNLSLQWQRVDATAAQRWAAERGPSDKAVMESAFQNRQP